MTEDYLGTEVYVNSTPDISLRAQRESDEVYTEAYIVNPNAFLKRVWVRVEVMDVSQTVKAHSLLEIALALIALIHGAEVH